MKSKTIIISAQETGSGRGILTLYEEDDLLKCKLRLYGVEKLNRYAKIGVYHNDEVYTANLIERDGAYLSSFVGDFDLDGDFYAAIIKTDNNNEVILSGGTYAGFYFNNTSVFDEKESLNIDENFEKDTQNTQNLSENQEKMKQNENSDEFCSRCAQCKYKEYFYSDKHLAVNSTDDSADIATESEPSETREKEEKNVPSIIEQIVPQFDYIFKNYPPNDEINAIIQNGKFVVVGEGDYSLGAIYEDEKMKYICYAVKCNYSDPVPEELGKHYQWLPLDKDDPLTDGYYIVFQDAADLKIIEV